MTSHRSTIRCKFFARGNCRNGELCPFAHVPIVPESMSFIQQQNTLRYSNPQAVSRSQKFSEPFALSTYYIDKSRYKWVSPLLRDRGEQAKVLSDRNSTDDRDSWSRNAASYQVGTAVKNTEQSFDNENLSVELSIPKSESSFGTDFGVSFRRSEHCKGTISTGPYTAIEQLTAEQMAQFEADQFEDGKIPTVPPAKEFCFR